MKLRKLTAMLLVCLMAAVPASAKITVSCKANQGQSAKQCTRTGCTRASCKADQKKGSSCKNGKCTASSKPGSKCPNGQANCKPGKDAGAVKGGTNMDAMAQEVVRQVNADRQKAGLPALKVSSELTRAACVRASEIAGFFSHTRPDGSKWSTVSSAARGENIARGQQTADKVMAAWMSSSGHRQNILRESFGSIGVCAYKVNNTMHWVQLFGK
ncbi:MAG: CAP domain-containing protein [Christensenellaceae bacterium]|nr:CAP domain-containing protein [Christensenellaceae bacterium]MEA5065589.1 CAP domain-containing protein [Eubacteriales bacterium]MEA5068166.1 CAP domain-containing protein [Christensenellaceae bacterium]